MIKTSPSILSGFLTVTFEFPSSVWAGTIHVAGDFNNWSKTDTPLKQDRDGVWRATLDLPTDQTYEYHFLVDGMPQNIYQRGESLSQHRSFNSILHTTPAPHTHRQPIPEIA